MILIVGAEPEDTALLQNYLAGDFSLTIAHSRKEALELARRPGTDLAVINFEEPFTESYDILLGLLDLRPDIAILFIHEARHLREVTPLVKAGLLSSLEKPFTRSDLASKIQGLLKSVTRPVQIAPPKITARHETTIAAPPQQPFPAIDPVSMDRLIMDLAHRLKNPLVAIRTFTHLLKERFYDIQFQKDFYQTMRNEVERMDSLIDQLIEFSELPEPTTEVHEVLPMVEEAIKRATVQFKQTRIDLKDKLPKVRLALPTDREQFVYALVNLMNGMARTQAKGRPMTISVTVQSTSDSQGIEIRLQPIGPHIPDRSQFLGLELFIAKRIIERQHGTINWTVSPEGQLIVKIHQPLRVSGTNPAPWVHRSNWDPFFPAYAERRTRQFSIPFTDRRSSQRRVYQRASYFPDRRRLAQATLKP